MSSLSSTQQTDLTDLSPIDINRKIMPNYDEQELIKREPNGVRFDSALRSIISMGANIQSGESIAVDWSHRPGQTKITTWVLVRRTGGDVNRLESYGFRGEWIDIQDIDRWVQSVQHWPIAQPTTAELLRFLF